MNELLTVNTIESLGRALFAQLTALTGARATGSITINSPAGMLVSPNAYLLPVVGGQLRDDLLFKTGRRGTTMAADGTGGDWLVPPGEPLSVALKSNVGGARHNLPAGTVFRFDPPHSDPAATATLDADMVDGSDADQLVRRVAWFEDLDSSNPSKDIFAAKLGDFPALMLVWQDSEPAEGTQAGLRQGANRGARKVKFTRERFVLYVITGRLVGDSGRRQEGMVVMQAASRLLTDRQRNIDGELLSTIGAGVEVNERTRLRRSEKHYIYALRLRMNQTTQPLDERTFNRWITTRFTGALPGRKAPEPTEPFVMVDAVDLMSGAPGRVPRFRGTFTLPGLLLSGSFIVLPLAIVGGTFTFPSLLLAGAFVVEVSIGGALALPSLLLAGSASISVAMAGDFMLPSLQLAGSFDVLPIPPLISGTFTFPSLLLSGSFDVLALPLIVVIGGGLTFPSLLLAGDFVAQVSIDGAFMLPSLLLAGSFSVGLDVAGTFTLPSLQLAGEITPEVSIGGGLALPGLLLAGAVTSGVTEAGTFTLPGLLLSGSFAPEVSITGTFTLPGLQLSGGVVAGVTEAGSFTLPSLQLAGSFTVAVPITGSFTLPGLQLAGAFDALPIPPLVGGAFTLPSLQLAGNFALSPMNITSLVAHWSGNGSTVASAPNRITGSSVGALAQSVPADQPAMITLNNGVQALSFDGVNADMKTPDVAALRFTARGYWAWHLRSLDTIATTGYIGGQWADGGGAVTERIRFQSTPSFGSLNLQIATSATATMSAGHVPVLSQLQAGCWMEVLYDGSQDVADNGRARCSLFIDGVLVTRTSAASAVPAALLVGDAANYWLGSSNGSSNKRVDIAHHYVGNDIPTLTERAALRSFEPPQWDSPNQYVSPIYAFASISRASGLGALSVSWPSSHMADDIGLLVVETANEPIATPSGWTPVTNGSQGVGTAGSLTATGLQVFWKRAASGAEAAATAADPGDHWVGMIYTFRGCIATGDPINVSAGDASADVDSTAVIIPGATTTVNNCLVVALASWQTDIATAQQSGETNASLSSLIERDDGGTVNGNGGGFSVVTGVLAVAGTYAATTATLATASRQARVSLALKPNP
jgi:hypothetical protein